MTVAFTAQTSSSGNLEFAGWANEGLAMCREAFAFYAMLVAWACSRSFMVPPQGFEPRTNRL